MEMNSIPGVEYGLAALSGHGDDIKLRMFVIHFLKNLHCIKPLSSLFYHLKSGREQFFRFFELYNGFDFAIFTRLGRFYTPGGSCNKLRHCVRIVW